MIFFFFPFTSVFVRILVDVVNIGVGLLNHCHLSLVYVLDSRRN